MERNVILEKAPNGIILDSDVIIELHQKNKLNLILTDLYNSQIKVYIPQNISSIDNFKHRECSKWIYHRGIFTRAYS